MTDTYQPGAAPDVPMQPQPYVVNGAEGGAKLSQEEANYRAGGPIKNCGLCGHFQGSAGPDAHTCETVDGDISPFAICDVYLRQQNSFPQQLGSRETQMVHGMMQTPPDQSPEALAQKPATRIGNRSYAG